MRPHYTLLFLLLVGHHHIEDGKTLVPVLQDVHTASKGGLKHTGGWSVIQNKLIGFFE